MTTGITITIFPDIPTQELLCDQLNERHDAARGGQTRSAKSRYFCNTPLTGAPVEICRVEGSVSSHRRAIHFTVHGNPAEILVCRNALSGNYIRKVVPVLLDTFKSSLLNEFPSLSSADIDAITEDHCKISRLGVEIVFAISSDAEAVSTLLALLQHCKITLDYARPLPHKRGRGQWKKPAPRVTTNCSGRNAFTVLLPYGQVSVRTKHDVDERPARSNSTEIEEWKLAIAAIRKCLFFEIDLDLEKFEYESDGMDLQLPTDHRFWTKAKLPTDPISLIWNEVRYALWLNVALLTECPDETGGILTWQLQEVLEAYFAGEDVVRHKNMGFESKEFVKVRNVLIDKAQVEILIPWPIHRLNLSESLGELLAYENRLDARNIPELACYALTADNVDSAIADLKSNIAEPDKPSKRKVA